MWPTFNVNVHSLCTSSLFSLSISTPLPSLSLSLPLSVPPFFSPISPPFSLPPSPPSLSPLSTSLSLYLSPSPPSLSFLPPSLPLPPLYPPLSPLSTSLSLPFSPTPPQGGIGLNAAHMVMELIRDNRKIVDRISHNNINTFVDFLHREKVPILSIVHCSDHFLRWNGLEMIYTRPHWVNPPHFWGHTCIKAEICWRRIAISFKESTLYFARSFSFTNFCIMKCFGKVLTSIHCPQNVFPCYYFVISPLQCLIKKEIYHFLSRTCSRMKTYIETNASILYGKKVSFNINLSMIYTLP